MKNESGQMMMIGVMILLVLLISVPIVVYLNQSNTGFGVKTQTRQKALFIAQEGTAYGAHVLTGNTGNSVWLGALAGNCPLEFTLNGSTNPYKGSNGGVYAIQCSSGPLNYEAQLVVKGGALDSSGNAVFSRALQTSLSQKTVAAILSTGMQASAALSMAQVPVVNGTDGLLVHWGPIVLFDTSTWTLPAGPMDNYKFPRKFSVGAITGAAGIDRTAGPGNPNTDGQEYWANSNLAFQNQIDQDSYSATASSAGIQTGTIGSGNPVVISSQSCTPTCTHTVTASPAGSGNYSVTTDTAVFDGPFSYASSTSVIFVNGNAQFNQVAFDFKNYGGMIITGNLILGDPGSSAITGSIHLPPTALQEYAYCTNGWSTCSSLVIPCNSDVQAGNGQCSSSPGHIQFRGFLYVEGNLIVENTGSIINSWIIDGVVRVDGQIQIQPGARSLEILYDDEINHHIMATPFELMTDSQKDVPVH